MIKRSSSSQLRKKQIFIFKSLQFGAAIIETIVVFPVLVLLGLGILHISLIAQAKSNLEYAALMAARVGATSGLDFTAMEAEVLKRMMASDPIASSYTQVRFCVLQPSTEAFDDFGVPAADDPTASEIPNDNLPYRSNTLGNTSQISIQDANILKVSVKYLFDTGVPLLNVGNFADTSDFEYFDKIHSSNFEDGPKQGVDSGKGRGIGDLAHVTYGTVLSSTAVVVMQTPARLTTANQQYFDKARPYCP